MNDAPVQTSPATGDEQYDVLVIGAGFSGLAAGIRLAYYDRRVCLLERHSTIGGLNSFYRLRGRNYDVGLHAVTNFQPRGTKTGPLAKLLRQLRLRWEEWALAPQLGSRIVFDDVALRFTNELELLTSEIRRAFPDQIDGFHRLLAQIADYDELDFSQPETSARARVAEHLSDPLLQEMLFCPLMYYGSAREGDMDWPQFCIMFRSVFLEGLARPLEGIRPILKTLVRKYKELGGELRLRAGVDRILTDGQRALGVVLADGRRILADRILSSAGWLETMRLCDDQSAAEHVAPGRLSFVETLSVLNVQPQALNLADTIVFFNEGREFHWQRPEELVDLRSGVICSPNNFAYDRPPDEGLIRVTCLANYDRWQALAPAAYQLEKLRWFDRVADVAARYVPDFRGQIIETDMFTPTTVRRFTGHVNGAVYGAPHKRYDGLTHLKNLFLCGTDQGLVGIIGSIVSGISMANRHVLQGSPA